MAAQNVGEEMVGAYLQAVKGCEFVAYNVPTRDIQGEIDVVGINMRTRTVHLCEVAVHLETGLLYVKGGQANNVPKLVAKFTKDVAYARRYFRGYKKVFMLWSPIVRGADPRAKHNQLRDVEDVKRAVRKMRVSLEVIMNADFKKAMDEMKAVALKETKEMKSPVMRLFQLETKLARHLASAGPGRDGGEGAAR
ncbi:MAG: hypothetical protein HY812_04340 [Planctomycetes bacterium]|nr:hypothetical protein [Planctomycetota bacterium]